MNVEVSLLGVFCINAFLTQLLCTMHTSLTLTYSPFYLEIPKVEGALSAQGR